MAEIRELINGLADAQLKEDLTERLDLVQHKIKFMESIPVCVLDSLGNPNLLLSDFLLSAGGQFTAQPEDGVYLVFFEKDKNLEDLMRVAPVSINAEWQSAQYSRICLLADDFQLNDVEDAMNLIEDLAEMLHPGYFIFGFEGDKWIRFTV